MTNLMYFSLFGGVLLLVFGIRQAGEGLNKAAGGYLKQVLAYLTRNRVYGLILGIVITLLTQSSSATTVMLVGFVNSGIMQFSQTLGVLLGADIGTTVTVQIIAFNILDYSVLMVGVGLFMMYVLKGKLWKDLGQGIMGFGFIFLSMKIMSDAMLPLKDSEAFRLLLVLMKDNPIMGILASALFTAIVHSSAATIGVALSLASQGLIDLPQAIPIIFGANIGTCATAVMVGLTGTVDAKRVAYAHTLFKVIGVAMFYPFMSQLAGVVEMTSGNTVRQIANAHSFFNLSLALVFLPFSGLWARFMERTVGEKVKVEPFGPKYLDEAVLSTPALALSQAARETLRMAEVVQEMLGKSLNTFSAKDDSLIEEVSKMDDRVDKLDRGIRFYLAKLSKSSITEEQSRRSIALVGISSELEDIGDIIDRNVMYLARKKLAQSLSFSKEGFADLTAFHARTVENFTMAMAAFAGNDVDLAGRVIKNKERMAELEKDYRAAHIERLREGLPESFETSAIHMDLLSNLEHVNSHITQIALSMLEARGEG